MPTTRTTRSDHFQPAQLKKGIRIETREHHLPEKWTKKLVMDHLREHPNYYKKQR